MSERQTKAGNQELEKLSHFCFHVYAQKSLIIVGENVNVFF